MCFSLEATFRAIKLLQIIHVKQFVPVTRSFQSMRQLHARAKRHSNSTFERDMLTSSMIMTILCSSQCFLRVDRKSGGGATKPPSPRMGSMMMAAVSSGAVCILSIHLKASWGPRQQRLASYSSHGGILGDICSNSDRILSLVQSRCIAETITR